jgi:hypothetical protein
MWRSVAIGCFIYFLFLVFWVVCRVFGGEESVIEDTIFETFMMNTFIPWLAASLIVANLNFAIYSTNPSHSPAWRSALVNMALVAPGFILLFCVIIYRGG